MESRRSMSNGGSWDCRQAAARTGKKAEDGKRCESEERKMLIFLRQSAAREAYRSVETRLCTLD